MASTQLDNEQLDWPSYEDWKADNPTNHRGQSIRGADEAILRIAYIAFVENKTSNASSELRAQIKEEAGKLIVTAPGIESAEDYNKLYERYVSIPTEEKVRRVWGGGSQFGIHNTGYTIPKHVWKDPFTGEVHHPYTRPERTVGGDLVGGGHYIEGQDTFDQLKAQGFNPEKFFNISDKIRTIEAEVEATITEDERLRSQSRVIPGGHTGPGGTEPLSRASLYDQTRQSVGLSEEERVYHDQYAWMVDQYAEDVWPEYKRDTQAETGAAVIDIPFLDPSTNELGIKLIPMDGIPEDQRAEGVDKSIREGMLDPRLRERALALLNDVNNEGLDEEWHNIPTASKMNYAEASQRIAVLLGSPEGVAFSDFKKLFGALVDEVSLSHTKSGGSRAPLSFFRVYSGEAEARAQGRVQPQTEYVENEEGELVRQDYTYLLREFREAYSHQKYRSHPSPELRQEANLSSSADHLSDEAVLRALQSTAYRTAVGNMIMPFHEGGRKWWEISATELPAEQRLADNVYTSFLGEKLIHPKMLVAKKDFTSLKENAEALGLTEDNLELQRLTYLDRNFNSIVDTIYNSTADIRSSWITHIGKATSTKGDEAKKAAAGRVDVELLAEWLDTESGKNFWNRMGRAALQGGGDLAGVALMGTGMAVNSVTGWVGDAINFWTSKGSGFDRADISDPVGEADAKGLEKFGKQMLITSAEERQADRALASMFGRKHSFVGTGATMFVPLAVDLSASYALALPSGGALSAAYLSTALSKYGLKATMKQHVHAMVGKGLREILKDGPGDTLQMSFEKAYAKGYIKTLPSVKALGTDVDKLLPVAPRGYLGSSAMRVTEGKYAGKLLPKQFVDAITKNAGSARVLQKALPPHMRAQAATDALGAISKSLKAAQYPAMAAPAFHRSAAHTYGDIHLALQGATHPDGKPLTPDEIHDRSFGGAVMGGLFTVATVIGLHGIGRGGLEDWVTGGATVKQSRVALAKLRGKDFVNDREFTDFVAKEIIGKGWKKLTGTFQGPVWKGIKYESMQEGSDALLNTYARSMAKELTSASDWDRPFWGRGSRMQEGLMGLIYGGLLGGAAPAGAKGVQALLDISKPEAQRIQDQLRVDRQAMTEISKTIHSRIVADLKKSGSPETAVTVEDIFKQLHIASKARPGLRAKQKAEKTLHEGVPTEDEAPQKTYDKAKREELKDRLAKLMATPLPEGASKAEKEARDTEIATIYTEQGLLEEARQAALAAGPEAEAEARDSDTAPDQVSRARKNLSWLSSDNPQPDGSPGFPLVDVLGKDFNQLVEDPNSASKEERDAAIAMLEQAYEVVKDNQGPERQWIYEQARDHLIEQIKTGVTDQQAQENLDAASEERIAEVQAEIERDMGAALASAESSGSGNALVTPSVKELIVENLNEQLTNSNEELPPEEQKSPAEIRSEAQVQLANMLGSLRRDVGETEDLAKIEDLEGELSSRLEDLRKELDTLRESAGRPSRRAYKGRQIGKDFFEGGVRKHGEGHLGDLDRWIAQREEKVDTGTTEDRVVRRQELSLLQMLRGVVGMSAAMNTRRNQILGDQERQRLVDKRAAKLEKAEQKAKQVAEKKAAKKKAAKEKAAKKKKGKQPPAPEPAGPTILFTGQSEDLPSFTD